MKSTTSEKDTSHPIRIFRKMIRNFVIFYLISTIAILMICFIFGWLSSEEIGNGFLYGSIVLALFGGLLFAGNTIPSELAKLSIFRHDRSALKDRNEKETANSQSREAGIRFLFTTLICGVCLFITGLMVKFL